MVNEQAFKVGAALLKTLAVIKAAKIIVTENNKDDLRVLVQSVPGMRELKEAMDELDKV